MFATAAAKARKQKKNENNIKKYAINDYCYCDWRRWAMATDYFDVSKEECRGRARHTMTIQKKWIHFRLLLNARTVFGQVPLTMAPKPRPRPHNPVDLDAS